MTDPERFVAELKAVAAQRTRVDLGDVWLVFGRLFVDDARAVDARQRLADLISASDESGLLQPSVSTDKLVPTPLPRFVTLIDQRPASAARRPVPWVTALGWASTVELGAVQYDVLDKVNRWLRDGGADSAIVPAEERSLELFDDEKAIAGHIGGAMTLWGPGRLSPELLRFENVPMPYAYRSVGNGRHLLMVENTATFRTCTRLLSAEKGHPYCAVSFGQGSWAPKTVPAALDHPTPIDELHYFGDLDVRGLEITREVVSVAEAVGLRAQAHASLWSIMLAQDPAGPAKGPEVFDPAIVDVLPVQLRGPATAVLRERRRIPQERAGYDLLSRTPRWWDWRCWKLDSDGGIRPA